MHINLNFDCFFSDLLVSELYDFGIVQHVEYSDNINWCTEWYYSDLYWNAVPVYCQNDALFLTVLQMVLYLRNRFVLTDTFFVSIFKFLLLVQVWNSSYWKYNEWINNDLLYFQFSDSLLKMSLPSFKEMTDALNRVGFNES